MIIRKIDLSKSIFELCKEYPELPDIMAKIGFTDITKPGMLSTVGRFMTIPKGAAMKKISLDEIEEKLSDHGFEVYNKE